MDFIRYYIQRIKFALYNKKYSTNICSGYASMNAQYGKNVTISDRTIVTDDVEIGDYTYVNRGSSIENCIIGKFCSISSGVYICPFEHNYKMKTTHPFINLNKSEYKRCKVTIGNDVLISLNSVILEGVTIGNGAVIGAGAVVTKDVRPYEIVGGVPAKNIGFRFSDEEIEYLESLKWWDWSIEKIHKNINYLRCESNNIK